MEVAKDSNKRKLTVLVNCLRTVYFVITHNENPQRGKELISHVQYQ